MPRKHIFYNGKTYQKASTKKRIATRGEYILVDTQTNEISQTPGKTVDKFYIYELISETRYAVINISPNQFKILDSENRKIIAQVFLPPAHPISKKLLTTLETTE
jgi:hypothetical protein